MNWTFVDPQRERLRHPEALSDVVPLLRRLVAAFGGNATARLLGVKNGTVTNWVNNRRRCEHEYAKRIIDLHDILTRALQVFKPATAMSWLIGNEPFLNHRRPIDVLAIEGATPLIAALEAIDAGAYA